MSPNKIQEFVEEYYMATHYSLEEKMHYSSHPKDNPYPATFASHPMGGRWYAKIDCGPNPFIHARLVRNLKLFKGADGDSALTWDEITFPKSL